LLQINA